MGETLHYLDYSCPTPEENLALDDALLEHSENTPTPILRIWEPKNSFVVLGRSRKIHSEVFESNCKDLNIKILRRQSGGGTVLQMPGCLNFSIILPISFHKECRDIASTTYFILNKHKTELSHYIPDISIKGISDLTIANKKVAGHAQKRLKNTLLFHGCFLLNADLNLIPKILNHPLEEPSYRNKRNHLDFIQNLYLPKKTLKLILKTSWQATKNLNSPPDFCLGLIPKIIEEKYKNNLWNYQY